MEIAGAMSVASQMALMCPPGFDEWVRRELVADKEAAGLAAREAERRR